MCRQEMLTEELAQLTDDNGSTVMLWAAHLGKTLIDNDDHDDDIIIIIRT